MSDIRKFAWIGAHSSAKTTTVNRIAAMKEVENIPVVKVSEVIRKFRGTINEKGGFDAQMFAVDRQAYSEIAAHNKIKECGYGYILCDRSIWDSLPYSMILRDNGQMTDAEVSMVEDAIQDWVKVLKPYDAVFFCEPKPLYDDGVRSTVQEFQDAVYEEFKYVIKHYDLEAIVVQ